MPAIPVPRVSHPLLISHVSVRLPVRSDRSKDLKIIMLRHQLAVLRRQVDRPEIDDNDRTLLGAIAAASLAGSIGVRPDTSLLRPRDRVEF